MELVLHTKVKGNYRTILNRFDQDLFLALAPAFPKMQLLRFDGSAPGDKVEIELVAGPLRQLWTSLITERQYNASQAWFIDEGQVLPPPLKHWRHRHLVSALSENESQITDQISFSTGLWLLDRLVYVGLYAQFAARKPIYKKYFGSVS